eukprot:g2257.t1
MKDSILQRTVNPSKVNIDVIMIWVNARLQSIFGFEDDVLLSMVRNLLANESSSDRTQRQQLKVSNLKNDLSGFFNDSSTSLSSFIKDLWILLCDAQSQKHGIAKAMIEQKKKEIASERKQQHQQRTYNNSNTEGRPHQNNSYDNNRRNYNDNYRHNQQRYHSTRQQQQHSNPYASDQKPQMLGWNRNEATENNTSSSSTTHQPRRKTFRERHHALKEKERIERRQIVEQEKREKRKRSRWGETKAIVKDTGGNQTSQTQQQPALRQIHTTTTPRQEIPEVPVVSKVPLSAKIPSEIVSAKIPSEIASEIPSKIPSKDTEVRKELKALKKAKKEEKKKQKAEKKKRKEERKEKRKLKKLRRVKKAEAEVSLPVFTMEQRAMLKRMQATHQVAKDFGDVKRGT